MGQALATGPVTPAKPEEFWVLSFIEEPWGVEFAARLPCRTEEEARRLAEPQAAIHGNAAAVQIEACAVGRPEAVVLATVGPLPPGWFDRVSPMPQRRPSEALSVAFVAGVAAIVVLTGLAAVPLVVTGSLDRAVFSSFVLLAAPIVFIATWFFLFAVTYCSEGD